MAKVITMPVLGQSVEEQRVLRWFKNEGDAVAKDEPLAEFETDKTNFEWPAPESGVLRRILAPVDAYVPVNAPIAIFGTADEPIDALLSESDRAENDHASSDAATPTAAAPSSGSSSPALSSGTANGDAAARVFASPRARRSLDENGVALGDLAGRGSGPEGRVLEKDVVAFVAEVQAAGRLAAEAAGRGPKASPLARAVATGAGLDLDALSGTGAGGRIVAEDVRRQAAEAQPAPPSTGGSGTRRDFGRLRSASPTTSPAPSPVAARDTDLRADMTQAQRLRADLLPAVEKATGARCRRTDNRGKAAAQALKEFPYVKRTSTRHADALRGRPTSVWPCRSARRPDRPGLRDAGARDWPRSPAPGRTSRRAPGTGKLARTTTRRDVSPLHLGGYASKAHPIINPPQVAILASGRLRTRSVAAAVSPPSVR
jgi:pyruvate dehydrogenase E2 component (dihydrolipoamide acetyltransferase)